ncbi:MAG: hypothetical protein ACFFCO_02400 [Promethearchaeota archaeon]
MTRYSVYFPVLILITVLLASPVVTSHTGVLIPSSSGQATSPQTSIAIEAPNDITPPPPGTPDWRNVKALVEYFYNDSVNVSWKGKPWALYISPFRFLTDWTDNGTIEGGVWPGNPGNATIDAKIGNNETTSEEVADFLNFTMENYVRFASWPSLSIFNFDDYENETHWVFEDAIASSEEFLNTTFHLVSNGTAFLADGFNATGIVQNATQWRILMHWNDTGGGLEFSYTMRNATKLQGADYIFSLARAFGQATPLTLSGNASLTIQAPYDRVVYNATPSYLYPNVSFPQFPIGEEYFVINETDQDFDLLIKFRQSTGGLEITRNISSNSIARGQTVVINVTFFNTGTRPLYNIEVRDLSSILSGAFDLVSGSASLVLSSLAAGESVTMQYVLMALQQGTFILEGAEISATDVLDYEYFRSTSTDTITVGAGLLSSEIFLMIIAVGFIVLVIILVILRWRFRRL